MGCCQDREHQIHKVRPLNPKPGKKNKMDSPSKETSDDYTKASIDLPSDTIPIDKKHLLSYIDFCKAHKNYRQLVDLISDTTEIENARAYIPWADKPKTIGSLAIVYCCQLIAKEQHSLIPLLELKLHLLVDYIRNGSDDLRDNSLMLLYYILDYASDEIVIRLLELNIFTVLMRSIMCSKEELRHLTASVCCKIYRGRPYAQRMFIEMKGGRQLIQQISWSSENDAVLKTLLEHLAELLQDKDDKVMEEYAMKLNEDRAIDIIRDICNEDKSMETLETIDYLMELLTVDDIKEDE